jgi:hypothetical protein
MPQLIDQKVVLDILLVDRQGNDDGLVIDQGRRTPGRFHDPDDGLAPRDHLIVVGKPITADHDDAQGKWFRIRPLADQTFLMACSAANWASSSDA